MPYRKFELRSSWLWFVGAVVLVFGILLLTRLLTRAPAEPVAKPALDPAKGNLEVFTRLIGSIRIDSAALRPLSPEMRQFLAGIDTMVTNRELRDAITRMERAAKRFSPRERAALNAYAGLCQFELANPNAALVQFEKALAGAQELPGLAACVAFNIGYLFLRYDQPESALFYWSRAETLLLSSVTDSVLIQTLLPQLLNNLGVAWEVRADTAQARNYYQAAAQFIDTTAVNESANRLRRNLRRTSAR